MIRKAAGEAKASPSGGAAAPAAGLYIHVPFCNVRCPFCSFAITTVLEERDAWTAALERELELRAPGWPDRFDTVYLGGGTPSLLAPAAIGRILGAARARLDVDPGAEVTLEMNPADLEPPALARLRAAGIDRLSIGVQSFDDDDLELLGRDHDAGASRRAFRAAREAGFANITIDLIYGLPGRDAAHWKRQIEAAVELGPDHVSAYELTWEPGTSLTRRLERGELRRLGDREAQELFLLARERLAAAGFEQYEVSSFARGERFRSRHNRKYWEGAPYLGLGPSAHSYRRPRRSWNTKSTRRYVRLLAAGELPAAGEEELSPREERLERLFLGLRTVEGVPIAGIDEAESGPAPALAIVARLVEEGKAVIDRGRLRLTPTGLALADGIAVELARAGEEGST